MNLLPDTPSTSKFEDTELKNVCSESLIKSVKFCNPLEYFQEDDKSGEQEQSEEKTNGWFAFFGEIWELFTQVFFRIFSKS